MVPARPDAATLLARALRISAAAHGVSIDACSIADRPWASATFEGVRHEIGLTLSGDNTRRWLGLLPDAELPIRHHIVADLAIESVDGRGDRIAATLTALTLAER